MSSAAAAAETVASSATASKRPRLEQLCLQQLVKQWHPSCGLEGPNGEPLETELSKKLWAALKAEQSRQGSGPVTCAIMFPFVRSAWRIDALDLSDSGKWINDTSLAALQYVPTLRSVRLTACRFVTDAGLSFVPALQLHTLDVSWTQVSDSAISASIARCPTLSSLNLTGLESVTDRGIAALLGLTGLRRLALCATSITDAGLDYLTYYTRFPDTQKGVSGVDGLRWLDISNTRISDTGVGKLVATKDEDGNPYGKVFKQLEYLGLSMTSGVGPAAVRQVQMKYGLDTPLPNAQRTLAKSNGVALEAQSWVIRFNPTKERQLPAVQRSWEQARVLNYVAQYTKEMAEAEKIIARLNAGETPLPATDGAPPEKRFKSA